MRPDYEHTYIRLPVQPDNGFAGPSFGGDADEAATLQQDSGGDGRPCDCWTRGGACAAAVLDPYRLCRVQDWPLRWRCDDDDAAELPALGEGNQRCRRHQGRRSAPADRG